MDDGGDDMDQYVFKIHRHAFELLYVVDIVSNTVSVDRDEPTLRLEIVEQPPEKCVYKRNIKPAPTVMVVGEQGNGDANVFVAVTLTRCDTGELQTKLLTGNKPVQCVQNNVFSGGPSFVCADEALCLCRVASGRVIPFKRLKILVTSHQMNETLFSLRFELRRYNSDSPDDYELLQSIASNPICVLSHSTQLKPSSSISPVVLEVLPMSGPPTGFTRVAVLGANFVESPTTRVKFDNTEVIPIFHGPKTLICHTPKHAPGIVEVRVCNDAKKWSESCAHFKYDDNVPIDDDKQASGSDQQLRHGSSGVWETAFEGGYETVRVLQSQPSLTHRLGQLPSSQQTQVAQSLRRAAQSLDSRGYASLHYAASYNLTGLSHWLIVSLKLDAAILDKEGNTPLHWAAWNGQLEACQFFVAAAQVNPDIQNAEGQTALHLAAASGHIRVVDFLLRSNADPNITNMDGHSALLSAIIAESPSQIIELLVSGGAHLNTQDNVGDAPLHWAVRGSAAATIEYLLKQGAYTEEANEDGETPLTLAMICSDSDSANALLRFGASYHRSMLAVNTQQHHDESCMMYDDAESSDGTEEEYFDEEIMTDTNDSWSSSSRTMACGRMSSMVMSDDEVMVQPKPALLRRDLSCGGTGLLAQGMEQCSISSQ
jgi:ankyrin repeat protein